MWMATAALAQRFDLPILPMSEITQLANSADPTSEGLTFLQTGQALKAAGYEVVTLEAGLFPQIKDQVYAYSESGLPVILSVACEDWNNTGHVLVVVGHKYSVEPVSKSNVRPNGTYHASDWVSHFLVNDDQRGPYLGFLIRRTCCERVKFSGDKFGPYHPTVDGCRQRIEGLTQRRVAG